MAVSYTWKINTLDYYQQYDEKTEVVFKVSWQYQGEETIGGKTYMSKLVGNQDIPLNSLQNFTPFSDLTLEIVSGWVEDQLGEFQMQAMKTQISNRIQNQISPPSVTVNPPWI